MRQAMQDSSSILLRNYTPVENNYGIAVVVAPGQAIEGAAHPQGSHGHSNLVKLIRDMLGARCHRWIVKYRHGQTRHQHTSGRTAHFIGPIPERAGAQENHAVLIAEKLPELARRAINAMTQHENAARLQ